jgi:hypothetical protein
VEPFLSVRGTKAWAGLWRSIKTPSDLLPVPEPSGSRVALCLSLAGSTSDGSCSELEREVGAPRSARADSELTAGVAPDFAPYSGKTVGGTGTHRRAGLRTHGTRVPRQATQPFALLQKAKGLRRSGHPRGGAMVVTLKERVWRLRERLYSPWAQSSGIGAIRSLWVRNPA